MMTLPKNESIYIDSPSKISVHIKREDLLHPTIYGNKYRKLRYNIEAAAKLGKDTLLTFGGAFSNHIAATAAAGNQFGFKTVGIIRGDELATKIADNPTLAFAEEQGMELKFISRAAYKTKSTAPFLRALEKEYSNFYTLPEGGTNDLAIKGCEEILRKNDEIFDYICVAVGTGGTIAGLINSAGKKQQVLGFSSLKGDFLSNTVSALSKANTNWQLNTDYHFGGYGKINADLITFMNEFHSKTKIPLDPVYTAKMVFGVLDLIEKGYFKKGSKLLLIHTGGLQGIKGMNLKLQAKGLPTIEYTNEVY